VQTLGTERTSDWWDHGRTLLTNNNLANC
jgi:hypothetical protein